MKSVRVKIKKLSPDAIIPQYHSEGAAGFDFHCIEDIELYPYDIQIIKTGLAISLPLGYELQVRPRSGLSLKTKARVCNSPGTVDSDFRGEIGIIMENTGVEIIKFNKHDRIAQGVLNEIPQAEFVEVDELDETARGDGGYGSTNK